MASKKSIKILVKTTKKVKKLPKSVMVEHAKELTPETAVKKIAELKAKKTRYFVVEDADTQTKTVYKLSVSGKNYTHQTAKL